MKHTVKFERFKSDCSGLKENKTVTVEFDEINDTNVEQFEHLVWNTLFTKKNTKPIPGWSSWLNSN